MKRTAIFASLILTLAVTASGQTLEECQQAAERNYPLIRQYDLIEKTTSLTLSNIQKGWLPQVAATAQATLQSDVTTWPEQMQTVYQQMGLDMKGLRKDQYRVGIDVQQMVYDGGAISSQKVIVSEQARVQEAQTEVTLYQIQRRVNEMYFSLLLLDEQIRQNGDLENLLAANERKLSAMYQRGTAAESDYLAVKAERLGVAQQAKNLQAQRRTVARMLYAFCGMEAPAGGPEAVTLVKPSMATAPAAGAIAQRPELKAIDAQLRLAEAEERSLDAQLRPRLQVFAQGFYGYPGYNMFEDMMRHRWSLNGMIGARMTWNIGALYTRKNDKARLAAQRSTYNVQRDVFTFNNQLEQLQQNDNIERCRQLMADDEEMILLRASVRKAAESKLAHGIIDVNDLLKEINAENAARLQRSVHEIEMLKQLYDLKFTTNN